MFFLGADQGINMDSEQLIINRSMHFLRYLAGIVTLCPLNSCRIKRSRALEQRDQAIKDDFHRSRFLIPSRKRFYRQRVCDYPLWLSPRLFDDITHDLISEAFPLHICTLQVIKDWKWWRHRNASIDLP